MVMIAIFLLGVGNFAWHRAVMESDHPMMAALSRSTREAMRWSSLALEFVLLCVALYAATRGAGYWLWGYALYSAMNGTAAWLVASRRI